MPHVLNPKLGSLEKLMSSHPACLAHHVRDIVKHCLRACGPAHLPLGWGFPLWRRPLHTCRLQAGPVTQNTSDQDRSTKPITLPTPSILYPLLPQNHPNSPPVQLLDLIVAPHTPFAFLFLKLCCCESSLHLLFHLDSPFPTAIQPSRIDTCVSSSPMAESVLKGMPAALDQDKKRARDARHKWAGGVAEPWRGSSKRQPYKGLRCGNTGCQNEYVLPRCVEELGSF